MTISPESLPHGLTAKGGLERLTSVTLLTPAELLLAARIDDVDSTCERSMRLISVVYLPDRDHYMFEYWMNVGSKAPWTWDDVERVREKLRQQTCNHPLSPL